MRAIGDALRYNRCLLKVDLKENGLDLACAEIFGDALKANGVLQQVLAS